jgi:outer membrane murein-binding lipoprotein Lpp
MRLNAGMTAGFVVGVVIAGGALTWLRVQENVTRDRAAAHVAELDAQVQRLEQTVARLSDEVASNRRMFQVLPTALPASALVTLKPDGK